MATYCKKLKTHTAGKVIAVKTVAEISPTSADIVKKTSKKHKK